MAEPIEVNPSVRVPASALEAKAVRASGPGGQNVNKVSSRIELLVDLSAVEGLDDDARLRLDRLVGRQRDAIGRLRVTAQESRDQHRNLARAREKVTELIAAALVVPKRRRPTRPSRSKVEQRLAVKKRDARIKKTRRSKSEDD
ncbi:MAG: alternative ribosome rescue aminoacyl-tRNA hydrolase ArfB [Thermoanaerobaculia bacterium]